MRRARTATARSRQPRARAAAIAALAALLSACASAPPYTDPGPRAASIGKSKQEVLARFGAPDAAVAADGEERLTYVWDRSVRYGPSGPAIATHYRCEVTFHLIGDKVTSVDTDGPDCGG